VALAADQVTDRDVTDADPDLDDLADELVPGDHRDRHVLLRPRVPALDVQIGPAQSRPQHLDQDLVGLDLRLRDVLQPQTGLRLSLDQRLHRTPPL
jgi:hypothetical protein